jgi:hypothetical protein
MISSILSPVYRQALRRWYRPARRRTTRVARSGRPPAVETLEARTVPTGTWTALTRQIPDAGGTGTMLLLSDGTVMAQGGGISNTWQRLTPDATGSYVNGTWTGLASMQYTRLYDGSAVLPDGRVLMVGGEYSSAGGDTNTGEIYDPLANTWTPIAHYPQSIFGDDPVEVLPDGRVLGGYLAGPQTYIYDPATDTWTATGTKLRSDKTDEESWVKLPDNSIISYDIWSSISSGVGHAQRYYPSTGQWVDAGTVPVLLSTPSAGYELGPAFRLPDGRVWFTGANGNTAFYDPSTNSWTTGPGLPVIAGKQLSAYDEPGAILPNGKVLIAVGTLPVYGTPTYILEFDPATNQYTDVTPPASVIPTSGTAYPFRMLMLPTGQVLVTSGSSKLAVYTPDGAPADGSVPTISSITSNGDGSFTLAGTGLNGINEGTEYGDDVQTASNYPIVQLSDAQGHVYYARSFNWSSTGVATGDTPVSTEFTPPTNLPGGVYNVVVIANGIASDPVTYTFGATHLSVTASTDPVTAGTPFTVTVTALDANDNPVSNYQGTVRFRSTDAQASLPARYTFTAADNGVHTFTVTLATAGRRSIIVTDTANHSIKGHTKVTVVAAPVSQFLVSTSAADPQAAGTPFDVTVVALDPYGNVDTNYQGTVTWTTTDGDPGVVLPADYPFQPSDQGQVTFAGGVTLITPGDQVLTATDTVSGITGSATVTVVPGPRPRRGQRDDSLAVAITPRAAGQVVAPAGISRNTLALGSREVDQFFTTAENGTSWDLPPSPRLAWGQRLASTPVSALTDDLAPANLLEDRTGNSAFPAA